MLRSFFVGLLGLSLHFGSNAAVAEPAIPTFRFQGFPSTDFYGADLQAVFDTKFSSCQQLCQADANCAGFVYNQTSSACFPKSSMETPSVYEGAFSAVKREVPQSVQDLGRVRKSDLAFLAPGDIAAAHDLARDLGLQIKRSDQTVAALVQDARKFWRADNIHDAAEAMAQAVWLTDQADLWVEYARYLRRDSSGGTEQGQKRRRDSVSAAINGYLRATETGGQATALMQLARALEPLGRGKDMIATLRLAQSLAPRQAAADLLDTVIGKYGFRVTSSDVESDSAAPRICAVLSDRLIKAGQDYEPFVRLPDPGLVVQSEDQQICVDGLAHGKRYQITLRKGLPAANGETLHKDVTITHYVRDRVASAAFSGRAYVLAKSDTAALPVETVNLTQLDLRLRRVSDRNLLRSIQDGYFARPLSYWEDRDFSDDIAQEVWNGTVEVEQVLNQEVTSSIPLGTALAGQPVGIYVLSAWVPGGDSYEDPAASQWFVLTDLGLSTMSGTDGLHVQVQGLGDAQPRTGIDVSLISNANAVLGTAVTDDTGYARFDPGLTRGSGGAAPALVVARDGADDLAFLSLVDAGFDLSDRGVEGRAPSGPVDVFLATDRGAYRAGETIHATVLARDGNSAAIQDLPLIAVLMRPDGVEYARQISDGGHSGGHVFDFSLGATVPRGTWTFNVLADPEAPAIRSVRLLVEDFIPQKIDFTQTLTADVLRQGETADLSIQARYLFGAPGADMQVSATMSLRSTNQVAAWPGYKFGRYDDETGVWTRHVNGPVTDAQGLSTLTLPNLRTPVPGHPAEAKIVTSVTDSSQRPVERILSVPVEPDGPMLGIRAGFDDVLPEGSTAPFELIALTPSLEPMPMAVRWTLNRIETHYQWYQIWGNWKWESTTRRNRVATGEVTLGQQPHGLELPVDWGEYELVVERLDGEYRASAQRFYAGWYASDTGGNAPDRLEMSLNKDQYAPGDQAQLRIVSRAAGTALVSVVSEHLIERRAVAIEKGETQIPLDVTADWGNGAYVSAMVLRPLENASDAGGTQLPVRALGVAHATITRPDKSLTVEFEPAEVLRPRQEQVARLRVLGAQPGEQVFVTVAAVDLGILNLTGFETPNPEDHFFGQRRLGMELRDLYGRLIDPGNGAQGRVRSGGDADRGLKTNAPPPTQELMARFSGLIQVGEDGRVAFPFDVPAFNGTVRLMAMAWSNHAVGHAEQDVLVRDPVVVAATLPRFLAPADSSRMLVSFTHVDGPVGVMKLTADIAGESVQLADVPDLISLGAQEKMQLELPLQAAETAGVSTITLTLTTPDDVQLTQSLRLAVVDNDPEVSQTRRITLEAGTAFTLSEDIFANLRPDTGRALVSTGTLARFDVPGLLAGLDQYPYGCTEQVTSQAMPLLALSSVAQAAGLGDAQDMVQTIDTAVATVLSRQARDGGFGLWRAESGDFWLDAYVTDFLSRARSGGHIVPQQAFGQAMDNLRNQLNYARDFDHGGEGIAYALLVLAREGAAPLSDLRYYADVKAEAFATPMAVAQLAAALASYGDQSRAERLFAQAGRMLRAANGETPVWRVDYGTKRRDAAAVLALAAEAGSQAVDQQALMRSVASNQPAHLSTQESAWQLRAAQALLQTSSKSGLVVNGAPHAGALVEMVAASRPRPLVISSADGGREDLRVTTFGVPQIPPVAGGYGYRIERNHFNLDGTALDLRDLSAGTRFVTVIRVIPAAGHGARLMVNDPLPAGVEIDNPNLLQSGALQAFKWLKTTSAKNAEFRSDRFLAAVDSHSTAPITLAYIARAVSTGDFHHPAASVEDMYRPEYRANTNSGRVTIR